MKLRLFASGVAVIATTITSLAQSKFQDQIGAQTFEAMAKTQGFYEDEELLGFVTYVGKRLEAQMPDNGYDFKYYLLDVQEPNAFATAGGYVYVTRGLLSIIDTEDELACVLGHEFTHVLDKHSNKKLEREILPTLLKIPGNLVGSLMVQDIGALMNLPIEATSKSVNSIFDRKQENDADEKGVKLAAKAGYDPKALEVALQKLEFYMQVEGITTDRLSIFDNHPLTSKRVEHIESVLSEMEPQEYKKQLHILGRTDGLVLGNNPKSGVLTKDNKFLHPDMNIAMQLPSKWSVENTPAALTSIAKNQNAGLMVGADNTHSSCEEAAQEYMQKLDKKKLELDYKAAREINGFEAAWLEVKRMKGNARSVVVWVKVGDDTGVLQFSGTAKDDDGYKAIVSSINSLEPIQTKDDKLISEKVLRFEIAPDMTLKEYAESKDADEAMMKWLELVNGLKPEDKLNDEYVKYIEVRPYSVSR